MNFNQKKTNYFCTCVSFMTFPTREDLLELYKKTLMYSLDNWSEHETGDKHDTFNFVDVRKNLKSFMIDKLFI